MAMETHNQDCPVCNSPINSWCIEFCPKCNWELVVIPDKASTELRQYLENKIKLHKKTFSQTNTLREEVSSRLQSIQNLEKEKKELAEKIKTLNSNLAKKSEEFHKMKAKADGTEDKQKIITQLEKKVSTLEVEIERIKKNKLFPPI
jgi:DNA repair exonuclease SbcCD ATPase subunit